MGLRHLTIVNTHNQVCRTGQAPLWLRWRCFAFRRLGLGRALAVRWLAHLTIFSPLPQLVGIVTRKDLANITNDMKREDFLFSSRIANDTVKYIMPEDFAPARAQIVE